MNYKFIIYNILRNMETLSFDTIVYISLYIDVEDILNLSITSKRVLELFTEKFWYRYWRNIPQSYNIRSEHIYEMLYYTKNDNINWPFFKGTFKIGFSTHSITTSLRNKHYKVSKLFLQRGVVINYGDIKTLESLKFVLPYLSPSQLVDHLIEKVKIGPNNLENIINNNEMISYLFSMDNKLVQQYVKKREHELNKYFIQNCINVINGNCRCEQLKILPIMYDYIIKVKNWVMSYPKLYKIVVMKINSKNFINGLTKETCDYYYEKITKLSKKELELLSSVAKTMNMTRNEFIYKYGEDADCKELLNN